MRLASFGQTAVSHSTAVRVGTRRPTRVRAGRSFQQASNRAGIARFPEGKGLESGLSSFSVLTLGSQQPSELSPHLLVAGMIRGRTERVKEVCALERASKSEGLCLREQDSINS